MLWVSVKIALALTIPVSTIAYAHELRVQSDCRQIEQIVQSRGNIQWALAHPQEALKKNRDENRRLYALLEDLHK
jgi:hypothetical protein